MRMVAVTVTPKEAARVQTGVKLGLVRGRALWNQSGFTCFLVDGFAVGIGRLVGNPFLPSGEVEWVFADVRRFEKPVALLVGNYSALPSAAVASLLNQPLKPHPGPTRQLQLPVEAMMPAEGA